MSWIAFEMAFSHVWMSHFMSLNFSAIMKSDTASYIQAEQKSHISPDPLSTISIY